MIKPVPVLPLSRDASSRFLPWLITFMVWLATLALAAVLILSTAGEQWRRGLVGSVTVQIVPTDGADAQTMQRRVEKVLSILQASPQVVIATPVSAEKIAALLEPWLGTSGVSDPLNLPMPRLIDVILADTASDKMPDTSLLAARLAAAVPGATLDDHGRWLDRLLSLAHAIEVIAYAVLSLISVAAVATVVFATRTGLAIHHDVIELLHLMGAQDSYVASQFQFNALWLGLKGGSIGVVIAMVTLLILGSISGRIEAGLLPPIALEPAQWAALFCVGIATVVICLITARVTVLRAIGRMP